MSGGRKPEDSGRHGSQQESRRRWAAGLGSGGGSDETVVLAPSGKTPRADDSTPGRQISRGGSAERLLDIADEWLITCATLRGVHEISNTAALRARAQELRSEFEQRARGAGHSTADVEEATFALAAFFDESVMRARGTARETWGAKKLALEWFNANAAGEEFFTRMEALRRDRDRRIEAFEVYVACVALGFVGRYGLTPDRLPALLSELWIDIEAVRGRAGGPLAPRAVVADTTLLPVPQTISRWVTAAGFLLLLIVVWASVSLWTAGRIKAVEDRLDRRVEESTARGQ